MVYIFTRSYLEGEKWIKIYDMKKVVNINIFPVFQSDDKYLTIAGEGEVNIAAAASRLFTLFPPSDGKNNVAIYIGFCQDGLTQGNDIYMVNQLYSFFTKRHIYPDMFYKHEFLECGIEKDQTREYEGFFQTAIHFLPSHCILMLKISSCDSIYKISDWLDAVSEFKIKEDIVFTVEEKLLLYKITQNLKLSETLKTEFMKHSKMHKIRNKDLNLLDEFADITIESKNERASVYGKLHEKLNQ